MHINKVKLEVKEAFNNDPARLFLAHRRVMTDLYKKFGLTGYAIEYLLLVIRMSDYTPGVIVTGAAIRKKIGRRFANAMRSITNTLVTEGYLEHLGYSTLHKHYRLGITDKALEFALSWRDSLNRHLESDGVELVLNARFSWEKAKKKMEGKEGYPLSPQGE